MADSADHKMEDIETSGTTVEKGKGKAPQAPDAMEESEDSSDESSPEDQGVEEAEPEDEDNMEEIDTNNIINTGRRTRGKNIDFTKAAEELPEDDDEDDDDDFKDPTDDAMEE
ncbi:hypothetical protein P154DRAFT_573436 [Amniculicola lignicola CBS 123094]|uniref:Histone chaperone domain-containing protein n=1 Tax=Amniculicola lignicola CBS 123094 TaxID=1392246 RepID=A0A6A5WMU3_9PLEO|nr:hypothetical protein P154DRAFT_573436 [Amniculicola lignicola CBS 123094]